MGALGQPKGFPGVQKLFFINFAQISGPHVQSLSGILEQHWCRFFILFLGGLFTDFWSESDRVESGKTRIWQEGEVLRNSLDFRFHFQ